MKDAAMLITALASLLFAGVEWWEKVEMAKANIENTRVLATAAQATADGCAR